MSTRNIRFPKEKSLKLLRGNMITRNTISSNFEDGKIVVKDVNYPIASRIFKFTDIDVETTNGWEFVKNNDVKALQKAYDDGYVQKYGVKVSGDMPKEAPVEIKHEEFVAPAPIVEEVVEEAIPEPETVEEDTPVEESNEEEYSEEDSVVSTTEEYENEESEEEDDDEDSDDEEEETAEEDNAQQNNQTQYNNYNNGRAANNNYHQKHKKRH